jgi:hypothetical protein
MKNFNRDSVPSGTLLSTYSGVDMSLLPPCRNSVRMHAVRANYQAFLWYNADKAIPNIPPPSGHGWNVADDKLGIQWTEGDLMPQELVEVLMDESENSDEDEAPEVVDFSDVVFDADD